MRLGWPGTRAGMARLREAGVQVQLQFSDSDPEQGHRLLRDHSRPCRAGRAVCWYGGQAHAPGLRRRWDQGQGPAAGRSGAFRFTALERTAIYEHVARQAAAAEHIRHCAQGDLPGGADAAYGQFRVYWRRW